ncbi:hypothetical protein HYZ05_00915 [Candidatus Daviesbacteria bacterium]|nr:hypothetical protein [Candidatus Daviesbacteria bacterium]
MKLNHYQLKVLADIGVASGQLFAGSMILPLIVPGLDQNEFLPAASSGVSRKRDKFLSNHSSPQQSCEVFWFNNKLHIVVLGLLFTVTSWSFSVLIMRKVKQ